MEGANVAIWGGQIYCRECRRTRDRSRERRNQG
jgi:hypothetical protein